MRRFFLLLAAVATVCFWRRRHAPPRRHPLGPQVCPDCGRPFEDLAEAGYMDGGAYVPTLRRGMAGNGLERRER